MLKWVSKYTLVAVIPGQPAKVKSICGKHCVKHSGKTYIYSWFWAQIKMHNMQAAAKRNGNKGAVLYYCECLSQPSIHHYCKTENATN